VRFDLTPAQRRLQEQTATRVADALSPALCATPGRDRWLAAGAAGVLGACLPAEHGGAGLGMLDTALALEALDRTCEDTGFAFAISAHLLACSVPIAEYGSPQLRDELLDGLASGRLVAANAITEDGAGSDVSAMAMTATPDGDGGYVLNGEKSWASNAPEADVIVTYAITDPQAGFLGQTAFAVPAALAGVTRSEPLDKMGLDSCLAGRVHFEDCRVSAHHRLGPEGAGQAVFQHSMAWERACLFAIYLGQMERQIATCTAHVKRRRQFGARLSKQQAVSHRIAEMIGRLEGARMLLYRACWLADAGRQDPTAAALSKVAVSEAAVANGTDAVQLLGAAGYARAGGVERQLRDALGARIFSGTSEIQRELIAKGAGL
jgi:clorobiocin biosynthesis protein CloN3